MPLTTYTAGEVLTAASLNDNFTFAAANPPGGLTLISTTTIGTTVASVTVTGAFSSTYDDYRIIVSGGVGSTTANLTMILGATNTNYYYGGYSSSYATGGYTAQNLNGGASWEIGRATTGGLNSVLDITSPNLAKITTYHSTMARMDTGGSASQKIGILNDTTSYTAFTIAISSGTMTGGTIKVYGYANS